MREIKFRAYDKHTKIMLPIVDIIKFTKSEAINIMRDGAYGVGINIQYQPQIELMQFTGLHDKNGKEIYEGDVVKVNAHSYDFGFEKDRIGEIRFIEGCFGFYKQLSEKEYLFNELSTESGYGELEYYEVIGNIYENPELLIV